ncbi:MAG: tRNA (adenosine(37)-N6)-threonylcarbamoyltransferase complex dimerization subunit type 1 TsaB [Terracidiphilus sp.]
MQDYAFLLAIDTCGPTGSVALGQQLWGKLRILGDKTMGSQRSSAELISSVCELLSLAEVQLPQLSAIVAVNGPGSFTGVRVGLAAVKGLAESAQIPVVAVSRLEVMAHKVGIPSAALDAHRNEIFLRIGEPGTPARELLAGNEELAAVNPAPKRIAVCDEAAEALLAAAWPAAELVRTAEPTAANALLFGTARVDAGDFVDLALLDGHYLRRSDAEIFGEAAEERAKPEPVMCVCPMAGAWVNEVMEIAGRLKGLPQWTRENYQAALDPDAVPRRIALMVLGPDEDRMTGFLVARLLPPQAELEIIAVDPRVQRRGLARKLFNELVYKLGLAGVTEVVLEVRESNQVALALYGSLGFVETGRRPRYYADPEEDAVLMRLELK